VRRYAKQGYIAIAPNLFARSNAPDGDTATDYTVFRSAAGALKDDVVHGDALAAHDWIRTKAPNSKIGITGFCMGGGIVLKQIIGATHYHAASMFYGDVRPGAKRDASSVPTAPFWNSTTASKASSTATLAVPLPSASGLPRSLPPSRPPTPPASP